MPSITFELASRSDDAGLRRLLRENPLPGRISLAFEREPTYFAASKIEGPFHQTLAARETETGEIVGLGNRAVRPMFVNGACMDVGYMSQLRIHPRYGQGLYLARGLAAGFRLYRELHADGRTPFYLMSIIEENAPARRLLASGLTDFPEVRDYARFLTFAISPVRRKRPLPLPEKLRLVRGDSSSKQSIVDFLNSSGAGKQFAPYWTPDSLFANNLTPEDFFVVLDGDRVVGCAARWDQTPVKQTVVRGYSRGLARVRWALNLLARLGGWPVLPEVGVSLRHTYASHLAAEGNDLQIYAALLRALYNASLANGERYFVAAAADTDPLHRLMEAYRPITYASRIYLVGWEDGREAMDRVDRRAPGLEIALL